MNQIVDTIFVNDRFLNGMSARSNGQARLIWNRDRSPNVISQNNGDLIENECGRRYAAKSSQESWLNQIAPAYYCGLFYFSEHFWSAYLNGWNGNAYDDMQKIHEYPVNHWSVVSKYHGSGKMESYFMDKPDTFNSHM